MAAASKQKRGKSRAKKAVRASTKLAPMGRLPTALAEAAWAEADNALARALADFDELDAARGKKQRRAALALLGQSLAQAARKRGLSRIGDLGKREPFDPKRHDLVAPGTPKFVRIRARGVARGPVVLVNPRASAARRKKT